MNFWFWVLATFFGAPDRHVTVELESASGTEPYLTVEVCHSGACEAPRAFVDRVAFTIPAHSSLRFQGRAWCGSDSYKRADWRDGERVFLSASRVEAYDCFATTLHLTVSTVATQ